MSKEEEPEETLETVSVIIPTYRLLPVLSEAIEAVRANSTQDIQLIVVDNSPDYDDGTRAYCENFDDITYLTSDHNSFAHAINVGLDDSVGDYIVWLNNDTIVPPDWDGRLIRGMGIAGQALGIENVHLIADFERSWRTTEGQRTTDIHDGEPFRVLPKGV